MAARASASPPSAHWPSTSPVAGLIDSETVPDPVQSPSIQCLAISLMATFLRSEFVYLMGPGSGCLGQQADSFRDQPARLRALLHRGLGPVPMQCEGSDGHRDRVI